MGWIRRHSLSLVLVAVFAVFTATTMVMGWIEFSAQETAHGGQPELSVFWQWWVFEYSMSLVADIFGAILLVTLTKKLREIGSAEDKGSS